MQKMTSREKNLLIVLGITIIAVFGFMFVIRPVMEIRNNQQADLVELTQKLDSVKTVVATKASIEKQLEEVKTRVIRNSTAFHPIYHTWEAENVVTKTLKDNKINYKSVVVSLPVPYEAAPVLDMVASDKVAAKPQQQANALPVATSAVGANVITINIGFEGSIEDIKSCLNAFSKATMKTSIDNWSYQKDKEKAELMTGTMSISLYCMDKTTEKAADAVAAK